MKNTSELTENDWQDFKKNQSNYSVLSDIIDKLSDITFSLSGFGETPYTNASPLLFDLEIDDKKHEVDAIIVLEQCEKALMNYYDSLSRQNMSILKKYFKRTKKLKL